MASKAGTSFRYKVVKHLYFCDIYTIHASAYANEHFSSKCVVIYSVENVRYVIYKTVQGCAIPGSNVDDAL